MMHRVLLGWCLVAALACGGAPQPVPEPAVQPADMTPGLPAPDFAFVDLDGDPGRLSDYRGSVVLLAVWASWCPHCKKEMPWLVDASREFHDEGFEILGVASDDTEAAVRAYVEQHRMAWRQTLEPEGGPIATLYRADGVPTLVLIDRDGTIVEHDISGSRVEDRVRSLLGVES